MKQMTLIEMNGFLEGKCIPSDLKANETNAEYLVRKFCELEPKIALLEVQLKLSEAAERAWESSMMQACGEDGPKSVADKFAEQETKLETALRECRSAGITIDNLEAKCAALLDELDKRKQESSAWQAVAEKQLALATNAEQKISELESLTAQQLTHPAVASVPEVVGWEDVPEEITEDDIALASAWAHGFNQCRAAMLQCSEPVTDSTNPHFESLFRDVK